MPSSPTERAVASWTAVPRIGAVPAATPIGVFFTGLLVLVSIGITLMAAVVLLKLFRGQS